MFRTGLEGLVKLAVAAAPAMPRGAPRAAPIPTAKAYEGRGSARAGGGTAGVATPAASPPWMSGAKRTLGLGVLGAGAAGMYGMHRQNEEDRAHNALVYAPMQGSMIQ